MKTMLSTLLLCLSISLANGQSEQTTVTLSNSNLVSHFKIGLTGKAQPDLYIDGKKVDYSIFKLLDSEKIHSVNVIKGQKAIDQYQAPNGVIEVTTKENANANATESAKKDEDTSFLNKVEKLGDKEPLILIDDVIATAADLKNIDSAQIESIVILKDSSALNKYNAPNGVIKITMKK